MGMSGHVTRDTGQMGWTAVLQSHLLTGWGEEPDTTQSHRTPHGATGGCAWEQRERAGAAGG